MNDARALKLKGVLFSVLSDSARQVGNGLKFKRGASGGGMMTSGLNFRSRP